MSNERIISCGVPQGSISGPPVISYLYKYLPNCLRHSKARMYADDTNITTSGSSLKEISCLANKDLENVAEWFKAKKLSLNVAKTEYMFIASDHSLTTITNAPLLFIDSKPIKRVKVAKSLGVLIDERLSWSEHMDSSAKKISSAIAGLRQARQCVSEQIAITIYNSFIKPLFDYCDIVWDNMPCGNATRMQKLQNRASTSNNKTRL